MRRELVLEGVAAIIEGLNPKLIQMKLEAYTQGVAQPATREPRAVRRPVTA
jgi:flagellar motor component MotA